MGYTNFRYRNKNTIEAPRIINPMTEDVILILMPGAEISLEDCSAGFSDPALSLPSNGVLNDLRKCIHRQSQSDSNDN